MWIPPLNPCCVFIDFNSFIQIKYLLISMNERITALEGHHSFTVEERLETGGRNKVKESEERESDNKDTESVSSTENISSRFSYCSGR